MSSSFGLVSRALKGFTQIPKIKAAQDKGQPKLPVQQEESRADIVRDDDRTAPAPANQAPDPVTHKEDSPPASAIKRNRGKEATTATKAGGAARGRVATAAAAVTGAKAAANDDKQEDDRPQRPQRGIQAPPEPVVAQVATKAEPQEQAQPVQLAQVQPAQVQPAAGRASRPGSQRNSTGAAVPRSGEEIWQLNLQLGKLAEKLGDPEDAKQGRRRYKSPTLQEKLHKHWGGTYGQMLEKEFAPLDVEEPPAPKYEPPLFLDESNDSDEEEAPPPENADGDSGQGLAAAGAATAASSLALAPAKKGTAGGAKGAGCSKRAASGGGKKGATMAAAPAAAVAAPVVAPVPSTMAVGGGEGAEGRCQAADSKDDEGDMEEVEAERDSPPSAGQQQEEVQAQPRRGARKAKATDTEAPPAKAAPKRPPARRTGRAAAPAGPTTAATADAGADAAAEEHSVGDPMEVPTTSGPPPLPPPAANPSRVRKSHLPPSVVFGSAGAKPPLPPPSTADTMDDTAAGTGDGVVGGGAAVSKRTRDAAPSVDDKLRQNKAFRLEQQQLKEHETMRQRTADLELKCKEYAETIKQLQGEVKVAERKAAQVEKDRSREANELSTAQRENERLKAALEERDEKVASLKEEVKQAKAREAKTAKHAESIMQEWIGGESNMLAQKQQQVDKFMKGVQRG